MTTTTFTIESIRAAIEFIDEHGGDVFVDLRVEEMGLSDRVEIFASLNEGGDTILYSGTTEGGFHFIRGFQAALGHTGQLI